LEHEEEWKEEMEDGEEREKKRIEAGSIGSVRDLIDFS